MKREFFTASAANAEPEQEAALFKAVINALIPLFDSMQEMVAAADPNQKRQAYKITLEDVDEKDYLS